MKVKVDADLCAGTGRCEELCAKVFKLVDDKSVVQTDVVPEGAEEDCRLAVEQCPMQAIAIQE